MAIVAQWHGMAQMAHLIRRWVKKTLYHPEHALWAVILRFKKNKERVGILPSRSF